MSEEKIEDKKVDIIIVGEVELKQFDPEPYIGKEVKIDEVDTMQGVYSYYVKLKALVELKCEELNDEPLYASKILGLYEDEQGKIGWGKDTKTAKFLKRMDVTKVEDLKGKTVKVQRQGETSYLTF